MSDLNWLLKLYQMDTLAPLNRKMDNKRIERTYAGLITFLEQENQKDLSWSDHWTKTENY